MEEYYSPGNKVRQRTSLYHPIDTLTFVLREGEEVGRERAATVSFHNLIHQSLQQGNFLTMNVVLFNDFLKPTTKILYVNMINSAAQNITSYNVETLTQHLNLQTANRSLLVSNILEAFEELKNMDVINSYEVVYGQRKSVQFINFVPGDLLQIQSQTLQGKFDIILTHDERPQPH
ncbi:hypothetical protein D3C74_361410 [compost metagenome]